MATRRRCMLGAALLPFLFSAVRGYDADTYHDLDPFELAREGNVDALAQVLATGEDPNRNSGDGSTLIYVASKLGHAAVVDVLLQAGAKVDSVELRSDSTSLLASVLEEEIDVAKMLLSYGADPDIRNRAGDSARTAIEAKGPKSEEAEAFRELMARYDAAGAMAFEDAPGTWRQFAEGSRNYYQNTENQESRWAVPPSCGWKRHERKQAGFGEGVPGEQQRQGEGEGKLFVYTNRVTGQVSWKIPPALSWKFVMHRDQHRAMWYNYATKRLQFDVPGELPNDLVDELMDDANSFWFNEHTGEMRWDKPSSLAWKRVRGDRGGAFWFNEVTGQTQWEEPVDLGWKEDFSHAKNEKYFWNRFTGEASFGKPEAVAWTLKKEL